MLKDRYCLKCNSLCEWLEIGDHRAPGRQYSHKVIEAICPTCRVQPTAYWEEPTESAGVHSARSLYFEVNQLRDLLKGIAEYWRAEHWRYGEFKQTKEFVKALQACAKAMGVEG